MRKNELIELLQKLPGNPEVVIWNGFVGDWHKISKTINPVELVKESREFIKQTWFREDPSTTEEEVERRFKKQEWDFPNEFISSIDQYNRCYGKHKKTIYVLEGMRRGKKVWDRMGDMEY